MSVNIPFVSIAANSSSPPEALLSVLVALAATVVKSLPKGRKKSTAIQAHFTIGDFR
jgi:hypothetical protein